MMDSRSEKYSRSVIGDGYSLGPSQVISNADKYLIQGTQVMSTLILLTSVWVAHPNKCRHQERLLAGKCADCGYDLNSSAVRFPECRLSIETPPLASDYLRGLSWLVVSNPLNNRGGIQPNRRLLRESKESILANHNIQ
jgi:hypothetical protein